MNWDAYFHTICEAVGKKSNCLSRQIGAILVRDKSIVATGYNGPPRSIPHCSSKERRDYILDLYSHMMDNTTIHQMKGMLDVCPRQIMGYRSGEGIDYCIAAHAERNCLINAARLGVSTLGTTLYLNTSLPCKDCLIELINAGVSEIVADDLSPYNDIGFLLQHSDVKCRTFVLSPIQDS